MEPIQNEYATLMTDVRDMIEYTYQPKHEPPQAVMPVASAEPQEKGEGEDNSGDKQLEEKSDDGDKPVEEEKESQAEKAPEPEEEG